MGDLTVKPTSGGNLILQNDDAGAKIQLNNDDTIDITGSIDTGTFNGTVGSNATISKSGMPVKLYHRQETTDSGVIGSSSGVWGTALSSISLPDGYTAILSANGGRSWVLSSGTGYNFVYALFYTTDNSAPDTSDNLIAGASPYTDLSSGTLAITAFVEGRVANSSGSTQTLSFKLAIKSHGGSGRWEGHTNWPINMNALVYKT
tara:strand:+ start:1517 stop:2128 length:612 start_codon:yes stop_codon:yes gene_type:complete